LLAIADAIKTPYEDVLHAALHDCRYLPESEARAADLELQESVRLLKAGEAHDRAAATKEPDSGPGKKKSDYAKAARAGEPVLKKRRRQHDEATEAVPEDPTGMEPI
jgi:hypothetical protein